MTQGLTEKDHDQIWAWNRTVPASIDRLVHELIGENVQANPRAAAVCSWDGRLTYSELENFSWRLANHLRQWGARRNVIVPLCFEKSAWTVVAMLATIRTGAAFVLLDAGQPEIRLREIVSLTDATFVVASPSQQHLAARLASRVTMVSHGAVLALPETNVPAPDVDPEDTLFVVFTSGSTGVPKGVMSSHRSFASGVHHRRHVLEVPSPRVLDFASYSFDVSTDIILSTLIIGGCVCVPSDWERRNDIAGAINRLAVNSADLTPSVARLVKPDSVPNLQVLKLGGELASVSDIALWASKTKLVNVYGPSECLLVSVYVVPPNGNPRIIGRGHGAVTWIVDPNNHDQLVPVGAVGELVVEGPIVTKGYLHDPKRTASAFISPPQWLRTNKRLISASRRLYKTGDLVQYNPDGTLSFVGRKDTQVKVRGQRVELSEVEHHISQQTYSSRGIRVDPVVELITPCGDQDPSSRPILVCFLALSQLKFVQSDDAEHLQKSMWDLNKHLTKSLLETLPQYMVPHVFIPLEKFPLSPSGKTDRRQLQIMGSGFSRQQLAAFKAPSAKKPAFPVASEAQSPRAQGYTIMEQRVRELWSRVLKVELKDIAEDGHFFQLGGDSLSAIQLSAEAAEEQLSLTVEHVFANPILSVMAAGLKPVK